MTADANLAGASFHNEIDWHAIDWSKVHRNVRRPEFDIVRAQNLLKGKLKLHDPQTRAPDNLPNLVFYYDQQPLPPASGSKEAWLQRHRHDAQGVYSQQAAAGKSGFPEAQPLAQASQG